MREDYEKMAAELEECAVGLQHIAKILRGEEQDLTGRGAWRIWCDRLGRAMDCKVITKEQYEAFKRLSDAQFERAVAERDAKELERRTTK